MAVQVNITTELGEGGSTVHVATVPTTPAQDVRSATREAVVAAVVARCVELLGDGDVEFVEV